MLHYLSWAYHAALLNSFIGSVAFGAVLGVCLHITCYVSEDSLEEYNRMNLYTWKGDLLEWITGCDLAGLSMAVYQLKGPESDASFFEASCLYTLES